MAVVSEFRLQIQLLRCLDLLLVIFLHGRHCCQFADGCHPVFMRCQ